MTIKVLEGIKIKVLVQPEIGVMFLCIFTQINMLQNANVKRKPKKLPNKNSKPSQSGRVDKPARKRKFRN